MDSLIQLAFDNQNLLQVWDYEILASEFNQEKQDSWLNPQFSAGYGLMPVETRVGPQVFRFGGRQQIPWSGYVDAKQRSIAAETESIGAQKALTKSEIAFQIRNIYYSLYILEKEEEYFEEFKVLFEEIRINQLNQLESGKAAYSDVLLAERSLASIENKISRVAYREEVLKSEMAYWIGKDEAVEIVITDDFEEEVPNFVQEPDLEQYPSVTKYRAMEEKLNLDRNVNKWEKYPTLTVGLDYIINNKRSNVEISDNGRNALMPMIGISLPFISQRNRLVDQQLKAKMAAVDFRKRDEVQKIKTELDMAKHRWQEAFLDWKFFLHQISSTREIAESLEWQIASDKSSFMDYWSLQRELLDFHLQLLRAQERMQRQKFIVEKYKVQDY